MIDYIWGGVKRNRKQTAYQGDSGRLMDWQILLFHSCQNGRTGATQPRSVTPPPPDGTAYLRRFRIDWSLSGTFRLWNLLVGYFPIQSWERDFRKNKTKVSWTELWVSWGKLSKFETFCGPPRSVWTRFSLRGGGSCCELRQGDMLSVEQGKGYKKKQWIWLLEKMALLSTLVVVKKRTSSDRKDNCLRLSFGVPFNWCLQLSVSTARTCKCSSETVEKRLSLTVDTDLQLHKLDLGPGIFRP